MNKLKSDYQFEAIWPFIRNGAIPRSGLSKNVGKKMKVFIREEIFNTVLSENRINEVRLYELIELTKQELKKIDESKKKYHFGNAQKFVNLTLKSMWLVGWLDGPPPHFPIDRIIQRYIKRPEGIRSADYPFKWTDMSRVQYNQLILSPKKFTKKTKEYVDEPFIRLAEWELTTYFNHNNQ